MRKYAPYYDSYTKTWRVIAWDDDGTNYWFNEVPDAGSEEAAIRIADALNGQS